MAETNISGATGLTVLITTSAPSAVIARWAFRASPGGRSPVIV